jgi:Bardet-Biedl syndrome 9 protein
MSLFQAKEFWSTRVSPTEEFDEKHLLVCNIDNTEPSTDKIVVGSFQGYLRIYNP